MINDVPVQVIGVMPEGFRLPTDFNDEAAQPTEMWRPMGWDMADLSRNHGYYAVATRPDRAQHRPPRNCAR
jgi:hypothetical protein